VAEAQTAIDEHTADIQEAIKRGDMVGGETKDDYRVVLA